MSEPKVQLGTKAETLARLESRVTKSRIKPQVSFLASEWPARSGEILGQITETLGAGSLVVRSSAATEDTSTSSQAGAYTSVLGVDGGDAASISAAVESVIASYRERSDRDQVLAQELIGDVRLAGVLCARELDTSAPYYVFNYDREGSTDAVTSGRTDNLETYVRFRGCQEPPPDAGLRDVFAAVEEIEALVGSDRIEIELAVDTKEVVWILQVRWLTAEPSSALSVETMADYLEKASKKVEKLSRPHPHLVGTQSIFGVMPDWNPAEIIGFRPRALALTLYKELITDATWAYQRSNYGYRNLRSFPLLVSFLGVPYIDVRVSFNSFVPASVPDELAAKLVDYYLDALRATPANHDKVEFEIVHSSYHPAIRRDLKILGEHGFTQAQIDTLLNALRELTNNVVRPGDSLCLADLARIEELGRRRADVARSEMSHIDRIYWLLEDCKRWGTLPFSGLARSAFIATEFLKGFERVGALSADDVEGFFRSLETVTNRMQDALARVWSGEATRDVFLAEYGHLRPGTYDILSKRYDAAFDTYFSSSDSPEPSGGMQFELSADKMRSVDEVLRDCGLELDARECFRFIKRSIEGREHAKLEFTRSVSDALELIAELGDQCGLSREDLSFLDVRTVQNCYSVLDAVDLRDTLLRDIDHNREAFEMTRVIELPPLISSPTDVFHFHVPPQRANYVTSKSVSADVVREHELRDRSPEGMIVLLTSADPGYDWLFSHGIAGLITMFGGANSHMAVRCAEQGIPAVIGCGKIVFEEWSRARHLQLDCAHRRVAVVR